MLLYEMIKKEGVNMKSWDDVVEFLQEKNLLGRTCCLKKKEEEEKSNVWVWVLAIVGGIGIFSADQISPATIPIMIGFVTIPFKVFFHTSLSSAFLSG